MSAENVSQTALSLLAVALGTAQEAPELNDWSEIRKELRAHTVLPLVSDCVMKAGISEKEKLELAEDTALSIRTFHRLMQAQMAVLALLEAEQISAVVLKGASAARYYPRPELRQFGDIDLLVLPQDYSRAYDLLCASGYRNREENDSPEIRHIGFETPEGIHLELHRSFFGRDVDTEYARPDEWLYDKLKTPEKIELNGYPVSVLPTLENGLVLLGHLNHHLISGLGLRQIIDWMMYVRSVLTDSYWENEFQPRAEALGLVTLAKTATELCRRYLGLNTDILWCRDADEALVEEFKLYVLGKGNFGRKLEADPRKTATVLHYFRNPKSAFRYLTKAGSIHMKEAGYKPRKSVAWLYQLGHLLSASSKRESLAPLGKELGSGLREAALIRKLKEHRS